MAKPQVLFLGEIEHAHEAYDSLAQIAEILTPNATNRADFIEECKPGGRLSNVFAVFRTFFSVKVTGIWDEELVNALPKSVKFCAHNGAGYDQIDVGACSARDPSIRVSNVPTAVDDSTADTAIFLLLGALRGFNYTMTTLREGKWRGSPSPPRGHDPQGKVLGILGMGGIGRNMKKKTDAFGMTTIYHNRNLLSKDLAGGATYVSFDELLSRSDVISLNLPLNKHTHHIIGAEQFAKMKKGVIIINTARGAVIDEDALVKALESGQVGSCGLDVFEEEPKVHPGLVGNPHVMLLPHMGTWSVETIERMEIWCLDNVCQAIEKGTLKSPVPEQKYL